MREQRYSSASHPERIVILTAHTGAGHDSVATALVETLRATSPGAHVRVWALGEDGSAPCSPSDLWYDRVVAHTPGAWGLFYHLTNRDRMVRLGAAAAAALWARSLRAMLEAERPDLVVSVHPLCAQLAARVLHGEPRPPHHHCVVTDLVTIHRCWAAPGIVAFYVATPHAAVALRRVGIATTRIHVTGLPLRRAFAVPPTPPPGTGPPVVLLLGGGSASAAFEKATRTLLSARRPLRLIAVCGHNERLRRRLARVAGGRATVCGWSDDIAGLMRGCDVVVTKAGSLTLAEAFSQARPVLAYQALPGQEEGNIALLQREGLGRHISNADALLAEVCRLPSQARCDSADRALWWGVAAERVASLLVPGNIPASSPAARAISV